MLRVALLFIAVACASANAQQCNSDGNIGQCFDPALCAALSSFEPMGATSCTAPLVCCVQTPTVAANPPVPSGWVLMQQSEVTANMTSWAIALLNEPETLPMFGVALELFEPTVVLARAEWHAADFNNEVVHRGITLYVEANS